MSQSGGLGLAIMDYAGSLGLGLSTFVSVGNKADISGNDLITLIVVKSGRSAAGARATSSHTGALLAASDVTVDALFRHSGVIRTDTLEGYRGSPRRDITALEDVILRIGSLVDDFPSIVELDLNPVLVHESGATVVDARIRVT